MKVIEQGLRITSRYFGDGYVVRTIQDATTNMRYVAIRKDKDNGVLLCVFPHSVNYLFDLPFEFSQSPTAKAYLMNIDDLSAPYCENHKYIRVELAWPKRVGLRPPGVGTKLPDKPHTPDTITKEEAALSLATKNFEIPEYLSFSKPSASTDKYPDQIPLEPTNKPVISLDEFNRLKWQPLQQPEKSFIPHDEPPANYDDVIPPPSYDPWDMWAEHLDPD